MPRGGYRPGAGRKPDGDQPRTCRVDIRVSEVELAELLGAAGDEPLTTWMRRVALIASRITE